MLHIIYREKPFIDLYIFIYIYLFIYITYKSLQTVTIAMEFKDTWSLEGKL